MAITDRLSELKEALGLRWGVAGVQEQAETVVKALAKRAEKDPLAAFSLVQVLCADPSTASFLDLPSVGLIRAEIRKASGLLGESDLPRWVRLIAVVAFEQVKDTSKLLGKLVPEASKVPAFWPSQVPDFALGASSGWSDVKNAAAAVSDTATSGALNLINGRLGALHNATALYARGWSPTIHLIWWAQAEWSEPFRRPWGSFPANVRGVVLAAEFASVAPAADAGVNFLLKTLKDQDTDLSETRPLAAWLEDARASRAWGKKEGFDLLVEPPAGLAALLAQEPTGLPILAGLLGQTPADESDVSGLVFYRRLAEELLIVRHVFGA